MRALQESGDAKMDLRQALRATAAALAIATAVAPTALAAEPVVVSPSMVHPLLSSDQRVRALALSNVSTAVAAASKDDFARPTAGAFYGKLEAKLAEKRDAPQTVIAPDGALVGHLSIVGIVPPTGMDTVPVGICVQKGVPNAKGELEHTVLGTFQLMADGKVVPQVWTGAKVGGTDPATGKFNAACAPYRASYIDFINKASELSHGVPPAAPTDKVAPVKN